MPADGTGCSCEPATSPHSLRSGLIPLFETNERSPIRQQHLDRPVNSFPLWTLVILKVHP